MKEPIQLEETYAQSQIEIYPDHPGKNALFEMAPIGIVILNGTSEVIYCNRKAIQFLHPNGTLTGRSIFEYCRNDEDAAILHSLIDSLTQHPNQNSFSFTFRSNQRNDVRFKIHATQIDTHFCLFFQDISEILTLEQELRNFKTAIQSADDAIFIFDDKGMIFFTNPAFENQVGLSQEQILGREIHCFWSDLDPPNVHKNIWHCIQNAQPWSGEMTWIRGNHSTYDVEVRMTPIFTEEEQVVGFICVQRDISERKKIEKKLVDYSDNLERLVAERTKELAKLHDIAQLFHSSKTLDKRLRLLLIAATADEVFRFNRAFLLLIDREKKNLVGRIAFGPSSPEEAGLIWNRVKQLPRAESLSSTLKTYLKYSGEGEIQANQIAQRLGIPLSQESSILVQAIQKRRAIVVQGVKPEDTFDPSILQVLGNEYFAVIPLLVQNESIGVLVVDNIITHRPIQNDDIQLLEILTAQAALAIAHADAMEQLDRKVQEIESAYSELRASHEKLIEASKFAALGQMAATVAHEIRTPLVAIGGFVNLLLKKRNPDDAEYTHLNIIREEALRLEDVLNRLLFYARPSSPLLEMHSIQPLIEGVLSLLDTEFKEYGIECETDFISLPPCPIDRNQIRQVLMNILQNSIQSMEKGGTLYVKTLKENDQVVIHVRDTGVGIPAGNLSRIFEPFFSTKHSGTGLGMHVSQRIVQGHGGSIQVTSQVGSGTTVQIRLPSTQEKIS